MREEMREKKAAVIGLARSGIPAARFLVGRGVQVVGYDDKSWDELSDEARGLRAIGAELHLGQHQFAGIRQCDLVVLSPGLNLHREPLRSVLQACENRGAEIIGELELAARHCPAPMIAVTGTKGKSTTVKLIHEMLLACGVEARRAGNTGTPLIAELPNLSPQSWAVVEVSSFQLERAPLLKPRVAVLLNLLEDHQDYHPSLQQYWDTKWKLFAHQDVSDTAILNFDDARVAEQAQAQWQQMLTQKGVRVLAVSSHEETCDGSGIVARDGVLGVWQKNEFMPLVALDEIGLRGAHNASNVAAALAAVWAVRGDKVLAERELLAQTIRNFQSLPHRLEIVAEKGGITWVNDSQATIPEAVMRAVEAFAPPMVLIAGGRDKLGDARAYDALGKSIAQHAHHLVLIGEAAPLLEAAAQRAGMENSKIERAGTLAKAVQFAAAHTPRGGTVVLSPACSSFDQFKSFEDRGAQFRAAVNALDL